MSTATATTVTVTFDPTAINLQSDIILGATRTKAGAMTAAMVAELEALTARQITTLDFDGTQPLDGDFPYKDVTWSPAFANAAAYAVFLSLQTASPVIVWEKLGARTASGTRILASDQFIGTVEVKGEIKP